MLITRRQLLYAMLGALALAGASGILALFDSGTDAVWRVAGTSIVAALAAAIMMPMAAWADKPATRLAGLLGMTVAVAELGLASLLIWGRTFPSSWFEMLAWSAGIIGPGGLIAARFLVELNRPGWRWTAITGSGATATAAVVFMIAAALESFHLAMGITEDKWLGSGWAILAAGFLASISLIGLARPDARPWRWVGVGAAVIAMVLSIIAIVRHAGGNPAWLAGPYAAAAVVAHAVAAMRIRLTRGQEWVRTTAMIAALCTGFAVTYTIATEDRGGFFRDYDWMWRITTAFGLVCLSGTMALVVFGRLNRRPVVELSRTKFERVSIVCPRCERKLNIPVGGALCDGCRLHIHVSIQSARCAQCNYDLTDLAADKCPECGAAIPTGSTGLADST